MEHTWRWFGPHDPITLAEIRQTGATGIVTALHDIPAGEVWPIAAISERQAAIEAAGLTWSVVESVPVHDDIKLGNSAGEQRIANWAQTLRNLAACGITTVCYNFMPVLDWARTDHHYRLPDGTWALRFDQDEFTVFDLYLLGRPNADADYTQQQLQRAKALHQQMTDQQLATLYDAVAVALPGATETRSVESLRAGIAMYAGLSAGTLREHLRAFLTAVVPVAAEVGVRLAIHPDDPPRPLLGLPRIVSTAADARWILKAVDHPANGLTLCVGSYGVRADNDIVAMVREFGPRIHFTHLRATRREADPLSFHEATHIDGDVDMVAVIREILIEEGRRKRRGDRPLPMRPDHGHQMLYDQNNGRRMYPGYTLIGRMKGLAELRGVEAALRDSGPLPNPGLARTSGQAPPIRILHLGLGNFMRAHLAWYTAHAADAAEWGIAAFTGRTPNPPAGLTAQQGLYTLLARGPEHDDSEVITALAAVHGHAEHEAWLAYWRDPRLRIVTLTVTEAGYRFNPDHGIDATELAALRHQPGAPVTSPVALLLAGILARRTADAGRIVILPCDNLPDNGAVLAAALQTGSAHIDATLPAWIAQHVTTASSMVDRITPATTDDLAAQVEALTGVHDRAPVVTEPFSEWVIAGDFPDGRPAWPATFVDHVRPYEQRKLWLLNGAHSLLAYTGLARGRTTMAEAIRDSECQRWAGAWWDEASRHLSLAPGELTAYRTALMERFRNPRLHHRLHQIAADGSEKIRARVLPVLLAERHAGRVPPAACHTIGAWIAYLRSETGTINDAHRDQLAAFQRGHLAKAVADVMTWLDPTFTDDEQTNRAVLRAAERLLHIV